MYLKRSVVYRVFLNIRMPIYTLKPPPPQKPTVPRPPTCARCGRVGHTLSTCKAAYDINGLDIE